MSESTTNNLEAREKRLDEIAWGPGDACGLAG